MYAEYFRGHDCPRDVNEGRRAHDTTQCLEHSDLSMQRDLNCKHSRAIGISASDLDRILDGLSCRGQKY